jgi:threonine/homoserine/homoserine lactone efflux protein
MNETLLIALSGFGMGFIGSIPPTGPVALMVINRAFKKQRKFAFAAGVGGALAEIVYSALAVTGVGLLLQHVNLAGTLIRALSTAVLMGVGLYFFFSPVTEEDIQESSDRPQNLSSALSHLAKGFSVGIVNPTLILNWTVAVAFFFSLFGLTADLVGQVLFVVGVGAGIISWTAVEVWILDKFQQRYSIDLLGRIQKWVSVLVMGGAIYLGYQTVVNFG